MTKQQEIDALERFAASIPAASYLRPWLDEVIPQVRADIRNDCVVSPTVRGARLEAEGQAKLIITAAEAQAAAIVREADAEAECTRQQVRQWRAHIIGAIGDARAALGMSAV